MSKLRTFHFRSFIYITFQKILQFSTIDLQYDTITSSSTNLDVNIIFVLFLIRTFFCLHKYFSMCHIIIVGYLHLVKILNNVIFYFKNNITAQLTMISTLLCYICCIDIFVIYKCLL